MENQVDLTVLQCLQLLKLRVKAVQVEMQGVIPQTIRRIYDIIRENAGNTTGLDIKGADAGVMIQKTDSDGAMLPEPVLLLGREELDRLGRQIALIQIILIERLVVCNTAHGIIERFLEVGTAFTDHEVNIRAAERGDRGQAVFLPLGTLDRDKTVDFAAGDLGGCVLVAGDGHMLGVQTVACLPFAELRGRDTFGQHADALAVQGGQIGYGNVGSGKICIQVIFFLAHRQIGKQHGLGTALGVGYAGHQVDFALLQHVQRIRPVCFDVMIGPAGICGDGLLIFVAVAAAFAVLAGNVVGGIRIPCNSHNRGILHSGGCALQQRHKQAEAQQQTAVPFQSGCNSVHMPLRKPECVRLFSVKGKRCTAASVMHLCISNEAAGCHFTGPVKLASQSLRKRLLSFASQAFAWFAEYLFVSYILL